MLDTDRRRDYVRRNGRSQPGNDHTPRPGLAAHVERGVQQVEGWYEMTGSHVNGHGKQRDDEKLWCEVCGAAAFRAALPGAVKRMLCSPCQKDVAAQMRAEMRRNAPERAGKQRDAVKLVRGLAGVSRAGNVTVTKADGSVEVSRPYRHAEVVEIVRRGERRPEMWDRSDVR